MQAKLKIDPLDTRVVLGIADARVAEELTSAIAQFGAHCQLSACATLDEIRAHLDKNSPGVILLDESIFNGAALEEFLLRFTESAPVVVMAAAWRQTEYSRWVAAGDVEFIARVGDFVSLAAGLVVRRVRWAERAESAVGLPWSELPPDFASILRHEINNPLTGILGNAELLLAHYREKLPFPALQRVETVVDLAVRLRETTRRLSNAWERQHETARSA